MSTLPTGETNESYKLRQYSQMFKDLELSLKDSLAITETLIDHDTLDDEEDCAVLSADGLEYLEDLKVCIGAELELIEKTKNELYKKQRELKKKQ